MDCYGWIEVKKSLHILSRNRRFRIEGQAKLADGSIRLADARHSPCVYPVRFDPSTRLRQKATPGTASLGPLVLSSAKAGSRNNDKA